MRGRKRLELVGKRFGRLVVKMSAGEDRYGKSLFLCKCDCGNTKVIIGSSLVQRFTKSCGCLQKEIVRDLRILPGNEAGFRKLLQRYKRWARRGGREFKLTEDEFRTITQQNCYYCGTKPSKTIVGGAATAEPYIYNGVDRVDNTGNYTTENCVPCCKICNEWKRAHTKEFFLLKIKHIYEHLELG